MKSLNQEKILASFRFVDIRAVIKAFNSNAYMEHRVQEIGQ